MQNDDYNLKKITTVKIDDLQNFIYDLVEFLEDRMDCDVDDGQFVPNEAMQMLTKLNEIFGNYPH